MLHHRPQTDTLAKSEEPGEMPLYGVFYQGLHRFQTSYLRQNQFSEKEI